MSNRYTLKEKTGDPVCQSCAWRRLCLPANLDGDALQLFEPLVERKQPVQKNIRLYEPGQRLTSLYAIRSGSLKTYSLNADGDYWITGFHFPGDILGLDALHTGQHQSFAVALETSMICTIPYQGLVPLLDSVSRLRRQLMKLMSRTIGNNQRQQILLNRNKAEPRVANFLCDLALAQGRRGLSRLDFSLPMSRGDLANYLGVTVETVSRILHNFQRQGVLTVQKKQIRIEQPTQLAALAGLSNFDILEVA